eukprot:GHRQ01022797.1.p1 GENE.GHRQ01022797.1~~GHRQ01022797.1.p1  ORF type:complete len:146 (-),score=48.36 GHRQ01022797.1:442-879(-)
MAAAAPAGAAARSSLSPVDLAGVSERWDGCVGQLQAFDSHLEGQRQGLQVQLAKKVDDFAGAVAGFASRWVSCMLFAHACRLLLSLARPDGFAGQDEASAPCKTLGASVTIIVNGGMEQAVTLFAVAAGGSPSSLVEGPLATLLW